MSRAGVDLALRAAEVVRTRNVALAIEMEDDDEEMHGLRAGMFRVRMDRAWPHATTPTTSSSTTAGRRSPDR
jgi:phosphate transport system protein